MEYGVLRSTIYSSTSRTTIKRYGVLLRSRYSSTVDCLPTKQLIKLSSELRNDFDSLVPQALATDEPEGLTICGSGLDLTSCGSWNSKTQHERLNDTNNDQVVRSCRELRVSTTKV